MSTDPHLRTVPSWDQQPLFDTKSQIFQHMKGRLAALLTMAEALTANAAPDAAACEELVRLVSDGRRLVWTLLTACRASGSISAFDAEALTEKSEVLRIKSRLEAAADACLEGLMALPDTSPTRLSPEIANWIAEAERNARPDERLTRISRNIASPAYDLYRHLRSRMFIQVQLPGEDSPRRMSFPQALSVLKNSDDPALRKFTFCAFNAWFAERASLFADLLNAVTGYREEAADSQGLTPRTLALREERITEETFSAMKNAIRTMLPEIRKAVTLRAGVFGQTTLHASSLFSPLPSFRHVPHSERPEAFRSLAGLLSEMREALTAAAPNFGEFLEKELSGNWIETRGFSGRTGTGWCDNLPAAGAVAVFSEYSPGAPSAFWLSHLMGVASLYDQLRDPSFQRKPPLIVIETAGMLGAAAMERSMMKKYEGRPGEFSVLWQSLAVITNELLTLPFRNELMERIFAERASGPLSVRRLNSLTETVWNEYFGGSTRSDDRYIWAHKHHFYQLQHTFYDFQYTFGYLLSQKLLTCLSENGGRTAAGGTPREFLSDFALTNCEDVCLRHLGADITKEAFWLGAVSEALAPVRRIENCPLLSGQFRFAVR